MWWNKLLIKYKKSSWIQTGQKGGQPYSNTSPFKVIECSLAYFINIYSSVMYGFVTRAKFDCNIYRTWMKLVNCCWIDIITLWIIPCWDKTSFLDVICILLNYLCCRFCNFKWLFWSADLMLCHQCDQIGLFLKALCNRFF